MDSSCDCDCTPLAVRYVFVDVVSVFRIRYLLYAAAARSVNVAEVSGAQMGRYRIACELSVDAVGRSPAYPAVPPSSTGTSVPSRRRVPPPASARAPPALAAPHVVLLAEPLEHHRRRQEHGGRVRHALAGDVRARCRGTAGTPRDGRRCRPTAPCPCRPSAPRRDPTGCRRTCSRSPCTSNSHGARTRRSAVASTYMQSAAMSGWRAAHLEEDAAEERHRRQHVGLVDAGDAAGAARGAALPREPEGELAQPLA